MKEFLASVFLRFGNLRQRSCFNEIFHPFAFCDGTVSCSASGDVVFEGAHLHQADIALRAGSIFSFVFAGFTVLRFVIFSAVEETEVVAVRRFRSELAAFVGITRSALAGGIIFLFAGFADAFLICAADDIIVGTFASGIIGCWDSVAGLVVGKLAAGVIGVQELFWFFAGRDGIKFFVAEAFVFTGTVVRAEIIRIRTVCSRIVVGFIAAFVIISGVISAVSARLFVSRTFFGFGKAGDAAEFLRVGVIAVVGAVSAGKTDGSDLESIIERRRLRFSRCVCMCLYV